MNMKIVSMAAALALFGFVSASNASEAISLNKAQMDGVTAGWGYHPSDFSFDWNKNIYTNVDENVDINKYVDTDVDIDGNLAHAEANGQCKGYDCMTQTGTFTYTDYFSGVAASSSTSGTD